MGDSTHASDDIADFILDALVGGEAEPVALEPSTLDEIGARSSAIETPEALAAFITQLVTVSEFLEVECAAPNAATALDGVTSEALAHLGLMLAVEQAPEAVHRSSEAFRRFSNEPTRARPNDSPTGVKQSKQSLELLTRRIIA